MQKADINNVFHGLQQWHVQCAHVLDALRVIPEKSVQSVVTSPPYFNMRNYDIPPSNWGDGCIMCLGEEPSLSHYTTHLCEVLQEVWRILRDDGILFLNLGDAFAMRDIPFNDIKSGDLVGMPWFVAFAAREMGYYIRNDNIWYKPNVMPESVSNRCTKSHEYVFMLTKSKRYYYDSKAVLEPFTTDFVPGNKSTYDPGRPDGMSMRGNRLEYRNNGGRNRRDVWFVNNKPSTSSTHTAIFPPELAEICVLASSRPNDIVLDMFNGTGTTGVVSVGLGRRYIGVDILAAHVNHTVDRLRRICDIPYDFTIEEKPKPPIPKMKVPS